MIDRVLHVVSPLAGVDKSTAFQEQPPFTCYDSLDFWPYDAKTSRKRLAIRPGRELFPSPTTDPVSQPINAIATLNVAPAASAYNRQPMIAADDVLYRYDGSTPWATVGGSAVDTGRNVTMIPFEQKLYILNSTLAYKVYTYSGHSIATWTASPGTVPVDCEIGCVYDSRIYLAGNPAFPNVVTGSRQNNAGDWDVAEEDAGAAFAFNSLEGGQISKPVTALVAHHRQCMLIGHLDAWTVVRGNPRAGGRLEEISSVNGPICKTAWCKTPEGTLYYLSKHGLWKMAAGCGTPPLPISPKRIPEALRALDGINDIAFLEYCPLFRYIEIIVTGSNACCYHFFPETEAFFPATAPSGTIQAIGLVTQFETANESGVLVGTSAGLKRLDRTVALEGATAAFVKIGPLRLDKNLGQKSIIDEAVFEIGDNTTDTTGTVAIYGARDAEAVVALPTTRKFSTTITELVNNGNRCFPGVGGNAGLVHVTLGSQANHLSIEGASLYLSKGGMEG
jgi:hypothetical protein